MHPATAAQSYLESLRRYELAALVRHTRYSLAKVEVVAFISSFRYRLTLVVNAYEWPVRALWPMALL